MKTMAISVTRLQPSQSRLTPRVPDFVALMKLRVMALAVLTALVGLIIAPEPPASAGPASPENAEAPGSPATLLPAQSVAAAEPAVSGTKKRPSAMHARRHRDEENENAHWQDRRWPYWGERAYAEDRYWRGAYRNWVY
jgi:hypothetical protein